MPEERKLVTILFADIVGSTEIGLSHDPEVVRGALARTFDAVRGVLETHGGTVEKFIGDAVMAVFGVPHAHDDDADRAVRAAFALRERIAALERSAGPELQVRIGVNSGEVVTGSAASAQFLVTGPTVNAAARLQQAAAPGEIVVGELTHQLTRGGVHYGEKREVDAKGLGRVAGWPVIELASAVPEQHRGLPGLHAPLIGRDRELRLLLDARGSLEGRDQPHLVTVYGPPGAGKSRLVTEFLGRVGRDRVRFGRCLPYGEGITYYPVQLIVRADAGIDIAEPRASALEKIRAAALASFPGEAEEADQVARRIAVLAGIERPDDALPEVQPSDLREELAYGLRRYLERRAADTPLVLVFEDIHWAEPGLLDLIETLAEWSRAPLLLLCLARPDFRETRPAWGSRALNATAVSLAPLGSEDTRRLIAELLAVDDLPEQVRSEVVTRAEGNPLYVEEFLRMLIETGRVAKRGDRWTADPSIATMEIPPTLQGLITARIDRVTPEVKALLQRASLAGRLFSTDALTALADGATPDPEHLRDAIRRDLLIEADERTLGAGRVFRFKHVLIRDVAYSTVPKAERSRLHDVYGRWLEESLGDRRHEITDIIAFHAEQAFLLARELGMPATKDLGERALGLLLEAARSAHERIDHYAALNLYTRAGVAAEAVGATDAQRAEILGRSVVSRENVVVAETSADEIEEAIRVARAVGANAVLSEILQIRAVLANERDDVAAARASRDEALAAAQATGDNELITFAMWERALQSYWENRVEEMYERLLEALDHVRRTRPKRFASAILVWLAKAASLRGDLTAATRFMDEATATFPTTGRFFRAISHLTRANYLMELGDPERSAAEARQAIALFRELGQPSRVAMGDWDLGEALLALNDAAGAREALAEAVDLFVRRGQRGQIPEVRARLARALVRLGEPGPARQQAEAALAVAAVNDVESRFISEVAMGEVLEAEARPEAAEEHFRAAITLLDASGMGIDLAEAREHYARFLLRRGRRDEARAILDEVRAFWKDPLAERHRERIDALLKEAAPARR